MEAPAVQYVRTADGYNIAFAVRGAGRPVIWMPHLFTHIEVYWSQPTFISSWLEMLAAQFQVIQYDGRGQGMSTRGLPKEHSLVDAMTDLEAVIDRMKLDKAVLLGLGWSGHVAIRYAVENPERVEALVLQTCPVRGANYQMTVFEQLAGEDWESFIRVIVAQGRSDDVPSSIARLKQTITQEDHLTVARAWSASDVSDLLPRLKVPTLVIHPRDYFSLPVAEAINLTSSIANARMVLTDGATAPGDPAQGAKAIEDFLASLPSEAPPAPSSEAELHGLSEREVEVLKLLAAGRSNLQIADQLVISANTVGRHLSNIYNKIGAANRAEAAAFATRRGLV